MSPIRLATLAVALALLAFVFGARLGAEASGAGTPAGASAPHAPMALGGPDGRVALDGAWTVRADHARNGVARGWPRGRFAGRTVRVPHSPNAEHVTGVRGARSFAGAVAWFRTSFTVARAGDHALRFESVHHRARVWVDGQDVARHTGAYLPFEARVRRRRGRHALVVRADWRSPEAMKAAAWHRSWFNFGGINREVTVRQLGTAELDAPGVVTRLDRRGVAVVDVTVRVRNRAAAMRTIAVRGGLEGAGANAPAVAAAGRLSDVAEVAAAGRRGAGTLRFPAVRLATGQAAWVRARVRLVRPPLWSRDARLEPAGLRADPDLRRRLHPPPAPEPRPAARAQPEGPLHVRRAPEARRGRREAAVSTCG